MGILGNKLPSSSRDFYGYDIYYNKSNYELAYTIEHIDGGLAVVVMSETRENFYDELKRYKKIMADMGRASIGEI